MNEHVRSLADGESSCEISCETRRRAKPVRGGKTSCCHCEKPRAPSSSYCAEHRNEYQKAWARNRAVEFNQLRTMQSAMERQL